MRSLLLGAALCLGTLLAGASSASAQVVTYTTPYGGYSYTAAYPGATTVYTAPVVSPYVVARPYGYVAPLPVTPWYPGYYVNRPVYRTYYGPYYGWRW